MARNWAVPLDADEFSEALTLIHSVHEGRIRMMNLPEPPEDDWHVYNLIAVFEFCGHDHIKTSSIMQRGMALAEMIAENGLGQWQRPIEDHVEIHPAVIEAAAIVPLNPRGQFPSRRFLRVVEQIAGHRPMKPRDVERLLIAAGWVEIKGRGKGSHRVYSPPNRPGKLILSWRNDDLKP